MVVRLCFCWQALKNKTKTMNIQEHWKWERCSPKRETSRPWIGGAGWQNRIWRTTWRIINLQTLLPNNDLNGLLVSFRHNMDDVPLASMNAVESAIHETMESIESHNPQWFNHELPIHFWAAP